VIVLIALKNKINKKGLTLVEMMIALVILLLVFLALMQTALLSINSNITNLFRDEAASIAEQHMIFIRNMPFDSVTDTSSSFVDDPRPTVAGIEGINDTRDFRSFSITFRPERQVTDLGIDNKQVDIRVSWDWKGETFTHSINAVLRRPS
jgi:prepilin-type N-terminal cleavage/methylation domain-containing protein